MKQIIQNGNNEISIRDLPSPKCLEDGACSYKDSVISAGTEKTSVSTADLLFLVRQ